MPSISTLIGERFEDIILGMYPKLAKVQGPDNVMPDFEHPLFFAEAKVAFFQADFAIHLKRYQVESFGFLEETKPVVYLFGFHDFANANWQLQGLPARTQRSLLASNMDVVRLYVADNSVAGNIWRKNHYVCSKGHIEDCVFKESLLRQLINDESMMIGGNLVSARRRFSAPATQYEFSPLTLNRRTGIEVGSILPAGRREISDYFMA